jgi:hypothetical protein
MSGMSQAEREQVDEQRGEMRREVEEAGALPPIPVVAPEVEEEVKRGAGVGAAVGAVLGVIAAFVMPALGLDWLGLGWRLLIGVLVGVAAGLVAGMIGGVEVKEDR